MRAFVIDDDRDHAESIGDLLAARGYAFELAFSGEAALARFREADFDIVFMDVKLPGMNGVETFYEFRKIRPNAKVMLMTGYSLEHLVAQAVENGALGVMHKPFAIEDVLAALEQAKPRGLVLVVDDDPEFAASLKPVLMRHGYHVEIATSGAEALERVTSHGVNCLVLDLKMPVLSGLEVYLKVRQTGLPIPTIFVTGFVSERNGALDRLPQPHIPEILMKPFDPAALLTALESATRNDEQTNVA